MLCPVGGFLWTLPSPSPDFSGACCHFWLNSRPEGRPLPARPRRRAGPAGVPHGPGGRRRSRKDSVVVICVELLKTKFRTQGPAWWQGHPRGVGGPAHCGLERGDGALGSRGVCLSVQTGVPWGGGALFPFWLPDPSVSGVRPAGQERRKSGDRDTSHQRLVTRLTWEKLGSRCPRFQNSAGVTATSCPLSGP